MSCSSTGNGWKWVYSIGGGGGAAGNFNQLIVYAFEYIIPVAINRPYNLLYVGNQLQLIYFLRSSPIFASSHKLTPFAICLCCSPYIFQSLCTQIGTLWAGCEVQIIPILPPSGTCAICIWILRTTPANICSSHHHCSHPLACCLAMILNLIRWRFDTQREAMDYPTIKPRVLTESHADHRNWDIYSPQCWQKVNRN